MDWVGTFAANFVRWAGKPEIFNGKERDAFIAAALASPAIRTFCMVLAQTEYRISEALDLTPDRIDFDAAPGDYNRKFGFGAFPAALKHPA